ncbi:hypothetical protein [Curtobacterium sp. NPDC089185]
MTFTLWVPEDAIGRLRSDLAAATAGALDAVVGAPRVVDVVAD